MKIIGYVSTDFIVDRFKQDFSFFEDADIPESAIIEWIGNSLLKLPTKEFLVNKVTDCNNTDNPCIVIEDYRGDLPCDIIELLQVRDSINKSTFKYSTDLYLNSKSPVQNVAGPYEYSIQGNTIITNMSEGSLELSYLGLQLDKNKKPLVPNDEKIINYIVLGVALKVAYKLMFTDRLSKDKYQLISDQCSLAKLEAKGILKLPSTEQMLNITNRHNSLTRSTYIGKYNYKDTGFKSR